MDINIPSAMTPTSMYNDYLETPTLGNSELSEEEETVLRLQKARRAIEPSDGHYRRRLAFNIARLSIVEQSVILLDGPALSPASEPKDCPGLPFGLAFSIGKLCVPSPLRLFFHISPTSSRCQMYLPFTY